MSKQYRCQVTGLIGDSNNMLPPVCVTAPSRAIAKIEAARLVGGYWTDDTDVEILEIFFLPEGSRLAESSRDTE